MSESLTSNSLVQRLRELVGPGPNDIFEEAALEIERLQGACESYRIDRDRLVIELAREREWRRRHESTDPETAPASKDVSLREKWELRYFAEHADQGGMLCFEDWLVWKVEQLSSPVETGDDDEPVAQLVVIKAGDRHHFGWMTYRTPPVGTYQLYLRPAEKAVETGGVLAELKDWATYWSSAPPDDAGSRGWRFAAQEVLQKIQRAAKAVETTSPQLPIARVVIREDEPPGLQMYAPGLPPGAHELYCEPEAVAPYVRAEKAAESRHPCGCLVGTICPHRHAGSMCDGLITDPETGLKSVCPECYSKKASANRATSEEIAAQPNPSPETQARLEKVYRDALAAEKTDARCLVANCNKPPLTGAFCEEHNETVGGICGTAVDLKPAADVDDEHDAPDFTLPCANCGRPLEEHIGVVCPVPRSSTPSDCRQCGPREIAEGKCKCLSKSEGSEA